MLFKDHFSTQADDYALFRPTYPSELFAWLAGLAPDLECAWDCATGNGQAAIALASHFTRIIATDASKQQISHARQHPGVEYRRAPAENPDIPIGTCSLVTVAQAAHWFALDAFYERCRQVLKPFGILALWGYNLFEIAPDIDVAVREFYSEKVGAYWPPERRLVEGDYHDLQFPFPELTTPEFQMQAEWQFSQLMGYVRTWSATQRYIAAKGEDPVPMFERALKKLWPRPAECRPVRWRLFIKVAKL